jgi:hypothetical protein
MRLNLRGVVCQCILAMAVAATLVTSASAQGGNIRSVKFYTVKPDRIGDFFAEITAYNALKAKGGSTQYASTWASLTGPRVFALVVSYNKWADLDAGADPKMKEQATDLARISMRITDCTEKRTMASSTLRCGHARCDPYFSQKLLPAVRTMSATSSVGRIIASCASRLCCSQQKL